MYASDLASIVTCCKALSVGASRGWALLGLVLSGLLGAALLIDPPCWAPFRFCRSAWLTSCIRAPGEATSSLGALLCAGAMGAVCRVRKTNQIETIAPLPGCSLF